MSLRLQDVHHAYGHRQVLRGIDLAVEPGEILCLLGPSGDGKTTLLRLIAGLEGLQRGRIDIKGRCVASPGRAIPPEARHVGVVFQDYALFPHLTVRDNIGFGLIGMSAVQRGGAIMAALQHVGLEALADAWPHMLSGGQQQRVALARALAPRPSVLLLDEAFASLDARLRDQVRDDTLRVLQNAGIATLIVTHDAEEAMIMGDRIVLLRGGQVEQAGPPQELYLRPASRFAANFLGEVIALPAMVTHGTARSCLGSLPTHLADGPAEFLVRPEGLRLVPPEGGVMAKVASCRPIGPGRVVGLILAGAGTVELPVKLRLPPGPPLVAGEVVGLELDPERAFVFSTESA